MDEATTASLTARLAVLADLLSADLSARLRPDCSVFVGGVRHRVAAVVRRPTAGYPGGPSALPRIRAGAAVITTADLSRWSIPFMAHSPSTADRIAFVQRWQGIDAAVAAAVPSQRSIQIVDDAAPARLAAVVQHAEDLVRRRGLVLPSGAPRSTMRPPRRAAGSSARSVT